MRVLKNIIPLLFLFCSIIALPTGEKDNDGHVNTGYTQGESESYGWTKSESGYAESKKQLKINNTTYPNLQHARQDILLNHNIGRHGLKEKCKLWNNATIPYLIHYAFTNKERRLILKAMDTLSFYTCIKFVPFHPHDHPDYITILEARQGFGCKTYLGRKGGDQPLYLGTECFDKIGTILHLLLHVIGVVDEHRRPDRDDYISLGINNINTGNEDYLMKKEDGALVRNYGVPYDYNSVMHYSVYAASIGNHAWKTIVPKDPTVNIGQRDGLSVRDAMKVMKMYRCEYNQFYISNEDTFSKTLPDFDKSPLSKDMLYDIYFKNITSAVKVKKTNCKTKRCSAYKNWLRS